MSKFESFIKGMVVTIEFIFLNGLAGGYEFGTLTGLELVLYTLSSLIIATYIYKNIHILNQSILDKLK